MLTASNAVFSAAAEEEAATAYVSWVLARQKFPRATAAVVYLTARRHSCEKLKPRTTEGRAVC